MQRTSLFLIALDHQGKCNEASQAFNKERELDPDNALPTTIEAMLSMHDAFRLRLLNNPSSSVPNELLWRPRCAAAIRLAAIAWTGGLGDARRGRGQLA